MDDDFQVKPAGQPAPTAWFTRLRDEETNLSGGAWRTGVRADLPDI